MAGGFRLENFSGKPSKEAEATVPKKAVEPKILQSYEQGYKAGWDDALKSTQEDHARIGADLAASLERVSLAAEDIQANMMMSLQPLLLDMAAKVLPEAAQGTLGQQVVEILRPMIEAATDPTVQLVVSPGDREDVASLIEQAVPHPVTVVEEDVVGNGQVFLRVGGAERSVDLNEVLSEIQTAIRAFYSDAVTTESLANA